jgi:DNA-3-methyladenine glycosylase II
MSWAKVKYVKDLAQKVLDGTLRLPRLNTMNDKDVVEHLIQVKGIGPWTAEMILMFSLNRPDILPLDDLGIQVAFERLYKVKRGDKKKMLKIATQWQPYRTLACRYLWKSLGEK